MHQKKDVADSCLKTLTAIYMLKPWIGDNRRDIPHYLLRIRRLTFKRRNFQSHTNVRRDRLDSQPSVIMWAVGGLKPTQH